MKFDTIYSEYIDAQKYFDQFRKANDKQSDD